MRHAIRGRILGLAALTLASALSLLAPAGAAGGAAASDVRRMSDAQLVAALTREQQVALTIGDSLLGADAAHEYAVKERERARQLLAAWVAEAYKDGGGAPPIAYVLAAPSGGGASGLDAVIERIHLLRSMSRYQAGLVDTLVEAEDELSIAPARRDRLIEQLAAANGRAAVLESEVTRRAKIAAARAARRQERARDRFDRAVTAERERAALLASYSPAPVLGSALAATPLVTGPLSSSQLDSYLASKGSPLAGQGAAFMASGYRWRVDPRLLVAIAGAESNFGAITCGPHNAWGWACPNDPADFGTWAAGIETVTSGLRRYYLDEQRTSVPLIQQKYAPSGAANDPTGLNNHWVANVSRFLIELGGDPANVGPGPSPSLVGAAAD